MIPKIFISITGHIFVVGIYNYLLPSLILFAFSIYLCWSCFFIWWGNPNLHDESGPFISDPARSGSLQYSVDLNCRAW